MKIHMVPPQRLPLFLQSTVASIFGCPPCTRPKPPRQNRWFLGNPSGGAQVMFFHIQLTLFSDLYFLLSSCNNPTLGLWRFWDGECFPNPSHRVGESPSWPSGIGDPWVTNWITRYLVFLAPSGVLTVGYSKKSRTNQRIGMHETLTANGGICYHQISGAGRLHHH